MCIRDRHQPDALCLQFSAQGGKVREALLVYGKIRVVLHIIDVQDVYKRQVKVTSCRGRADLRPKENLVKLCPPVQ